MYRPNTEFWCKPYSEANLEDHLEFNLDLERRGSMFKAELLAFFDCTDNELTSHWQRMRQYELPNFLRAVRTCLPHWQLEFERGARASWRQPVWTAERVRIETRPGRHHTYVTNGSLFYSLTKRSRRVVHLERDDDNEGSYIDIAVIAPADERHALRDEMRKIFRWSRKHNYLRRQAISAIGTLLKVSRDVSWDDVLLEPHVRATIEANTLGLLDRREEFRRNHVPLKRGVLLHGPPGTGKTMIGKVLAASGRATFLWVTSADAGSVCVIRQVFKLARTLRPAIVFLEDLDLFGSERGGFTDSLLGELLCQLDGLEENDGLVVVATTNDLGKIEPALKDRPSRFDVVLEIGLPSVNVRREMLGKLLARNVANTEVLNVGATMTANLTGAQIQEVAFRAIQSAILRRSLDTTGIAQVAAADINSAVIQLTGNPRRPIGFSASNGVENP